jgi:signal transduction histidine kinase
MLDQRGNAAAVASHLLSLNLEAHEVFKAMESAGGGIVKLKKTLSGKQRDLADVISGFMFEALSWAGACLELGRFIDVCREKAPAAIQSFEAECRETWRVVDLVQVARRSLASVDRLRRRYGARIKSRFSGPARILGDEDLLYRAIRNLLENALEHGTRNSSRRGPSHLPGEEVRFSVTVRKGGKSACIAVVDNGVGMAPKDLAAAQQAYGAPNLIGQSLPLPGFGTMIVAFVAAIHGGHASVVSADGDGTSVRIEIPIQTRWR